MFFHKPCNREIRAMRGRVMRGLPVMSQKCETNFGLNIMCFILSLNLEESSYRVIDQKNHGGLLMLPLNFDVFKRSLILLTSAFFRID